MVQATKKWPMQHMHRQPYLCNSHLLLQHCLSCFCINQHCHASLLETFNQAQYYKMLPQCQQARQGLTCATATSCCSTACPASAPTSTALQHIHSFEI
jgi:hypothetical protein